MKGKKTHMVSVPTVEQPQRPRCILAPLMRELNRARVRSNRRLDLHLRHLRLFLMTPAYLTHLMCPRSLVLDRTPVRGKLVCERVRVRKWRLRRGAAIEPARGLEAV